jgi:hypothetical protein
LRALKVHGPRSEIREGIAGSCRTRRAGSLEAVLHGMPLVPARLVLLGTPVVRVPAPLLALFPIRPAPRAVRWGRALAGGRSPALGGPRSRSGPGPRLVEEAFSASTRVFLARAGTKAEIRLSRRGVGRRSPRAGLPNAPGASGGRGVVPGSPASVPPLALPLVAECEKTPTAAPESPFCPYDRRFIAFSPP